MLGSHTLDDVINGAIGNMIQVYLTDSAHHLVSESISHHLVAYRATLYLRCIYNKYLVVQRLKVNPNIQWDNASLIKILQP